MAWNIRRYIKIQDNKVKKDIFLFLNKKIFITATIISFFLVHITALATPPDFIKEDQYYRIVSAKTNKALDSWGNDVEWVGKYNRHPFPSPQRKLEEDDLYHQLWKFERVNNNYYQIVSVFTGKALDVGIPGDAKVAKIVCNSSLDSQLWSLEDVGKGIYMIISKSGNNALDVWGDEVNWVGKWGRHNSENPDYKNQLWKVEPVFHEAIREGNSEVVKELLKHNQSPIAQNRDQKPPIHIATEKDDVTVLEILFQNEEVLRNIDIRDEGGNGATPLQRAVLNHNQRAATLLVKNGANVTAPMPTWGTLLHYVSGINRLDDLKILLLKTDNLNCRNAQGNTPLHQAIQYYGKDTAGYLIDEGADINARTQDGYTPLHMAIQKGNFEKVKLLIDEGADTNARTQNKYGYTPLHLAVLSKKDENDPANIIQYLIGHKANLQEKTWDYGGTVFHCAAALGYETWEWLVKSVSVSKNILSQVDNFNKKPLDLSQWRPIFSSQLPQGKQMKGDESITKDDWQVSLFFTESKPFKLLPKDFGHAIIVFEGLDIRDDRPVEKYFTMVHIFNPEKGPVIQNVNKESLYKCIKDWDGRNFFKWQIKADMVEQVLNDVKKEKDKITWELTGDGKEKDGKTIHNCSTYALSILSKCGIIIPYQNSLFKTPEQKIVSYLNN